jgi:hypothetical protein
MLAYYVMDDRRLALFSVESLQQHLQLLEAQFGFFGHLRPRGLMDMRKVECHVLVFEIRECPLEGGKHTPRISLFER